jgi:signal transduction histidine kinase
MTRRSRLPTYGEQVQLPAVRAFDICLAVAVTVAGVAEIWVPFSSVQGQGSEAASTAVVVTVGVALSLRRAYPLAVGILVLFAWFPVMAGGPSLVLFFGQFVPMGIAVFTMARYGKGRVPYIGAAAGAVALVLVDTFVPLLRSPGEMFFHWGVFLIVWSFGYRLRQLEIRARESTDRAIAAEVAAVERAMAAVVEERSRIARELHDIVAHAVSMMVVQAGAARQVVDDDPAFVRGALDTIRTTGADALAEMRRVVAMLRDGDEPGALSPQPGLDAVPALVDDARAAGLDATLDVVGEARDLPAGVDLAAYRIVQEALTNVRRHASAEHVRIAVTYGEADVSIEVVDDGVGAAETSGGHGLVGMRERATLYGGTVETGTVNGRGFRVRAVLPGAVT